MEAKRKRRIYHFAFLSEPLGTLRYNIFVETKILADHFIKCFKLCALYTLCGKFYFFPQRKRWI